MTTSFNAAELRELFEYQDGPKISIFMPLMQAGADQQQNPIRLKNLLREVERQLHAEHGDTTAMRELLAPAWQRVEDASLWQELSDGLAIFIAPGMFRAYHVPIALDEEVCINENFSAKALMPLLTGDGRFYILALSEQKVRLLRADRDNVRDLTPADMPTSLAEALKYDEYGENQYYSNVPAGAAGARQVGTNDHYMSGGISLDEDQNNILRYFQHVSKGLQDYLKDSRMPLVLAGVETLPPIFRRASHYQHIVDGVITGNPDGVSAQELHRQAWPLVEPIFDRERQGCLTRFGELSGNSPNVVSTNVDDIVSAAHFGRVDTLFVDATARRWGSFDAEANRVTQTEERSFGCDDLLDLAAMQTLLNSGQVFAVPADQVPGDGPIAAIFRY